MEEAVSKARIDKWLWSARFFKTRGLAKEAVELGRVLLNGERVKASKEVAPGDRVQVNKITETFEGTVAGTSENRVPARLVKSLFIENEDSRMRREQAKDLRRLAQEPALTRTEKGRPVKKEIRALRKLRGY